ncbi:Desumoylating isopeptidase 1 isoform B [Glycine soja]|uniref:Desumoylating isopeptidase 1 isoform B n=1 Tax=Glycine soja TaxID=3848 RepID=A0A445FU44_GLYSO|nr:Desumoylating isopeptidase 1 isoform B [Glycine soja]
MESPLHLALLLWSLEEVFVDGGRQRGRCKGYVDDKDEVEDDTLIFDTQKLMKSLLEVWKSKTVFSFVYALLRIRFAMAGVSQSMNISCGLPILKGDNYKVWKERILLHLGWVDIDYAIRKDEPPTITETSEPNAVDLYEKWERSNRLSVMFIKTNISTRFRGSVDQHDKVRDLLKAIDEQFTTSEKSLASTLIMQFSSIKLTGTRGVREHIMRLRDIVAQLKTLEVTMYESFLGMESLRKPVGSEQCIYSGSWMSSHVEAIGINTTYNSMHVSVGLKQCIVNEESSMLWHQRLGHISIERIKRLVNEGVLSTLEFADFETCVDCIKDDYSRYMYLYLLHSKNEALDAFKAFKVEVEKQCGKQIKIVRSDKGGEYYGRYTEDGQAPGSFAKFLQEHGFVAQYTMPGSPDQNGVAERRN